MNVLLLLLTIFFVLTLSVLFCYGLYLLLTNFQPGRSKIMNDLREMESEMKPWISDLVPWSKKELELLSTEHINKSVKKGIVTTVKGIITTIYHEPLVAYAYKKYVSSKGNAVIYARTSNREFVYRMLEDKTSIRIDNQEVGTIRKNGILQSPKTKYLVGHIKRDDDELILPVIIGDKEVAGLTKFQKSSGVSSRAFEYINEMNESEEALLLSMSILELIKKELP